MSYKWIILIIVSGLFLSCVSDSTTSPASSDEENNMLSPYANVLKNWLEYPAYQYKSTDFKLVSVDSLSDIVFTFDSADIYLDPHYSLYKYSPDSSRLLDLYSYNLLIEQDDQGRLRSLGRNTDSQVSLFDLESGLNSRLLFVGPSTLIEDGFWVNNDELLVVGHTTELGDSSYLPHAWHIDFSRHILSYFEYQMPAIKRQPDYLFRIRYPQLELLSLP